MPRYPHLIVPEAGAATRFTSTLSPRSTFRTPNRNRRQHANDLIAQLQTAAGTAKTRVPRADGNGFYETPALLLTFESEPDFELKFESLDLQNSGIELLSVKVEDHKTFATVRVPHNKVRLFLTRLEKYRDTDPNAPIPDGKKRKPNDYRDLAASISAIKLATLKELWTDPPDQYPPTNTPITWEVWLRAPEDDEQPSEDILTDAAATLGFEVTSNVLHFVDRTVVLVRGTREQLSLGADVLGIIAEVRKAKVAADFFDGLPVEEQHDWIDTLLERVTPPPADAPVVGLLDTGLNHGHPLIQPLIDPDADLHTYKPQWGTNDAWPHGTWMAGLALYGDLAPVLEANGDVVMEHGLQSVKLINRPDPHDPDLYGAVTTEGVNRLEAANQRHRIYCMAITAEETGQGRPSSWSAAVDALASGADDDVRRLIVLAAGNIDPAHHINYPDANEVSSVQDPGQSWNALTIGGYTEKVLIDQGANPGWTPVASSGDIAPASTTSVTWTNASRPPFKPDIVMEAGNLGRPREGAHPLELPELMLLTTSDEFGAGRPPFHTIGETSAAAALAANLLARLAARYPDFTPETLRAMLVHSAAWKPAMVQRAQDDQGFVDFNRLLRTFGYGVPDETNLFSSANNILTLIAQDSLQPFFKDGAKGVKTNHIKHHALPWPAEVLRDLPLGTEVQMRVTLSYFVEPSPGERGWDKKYGYASHGLRFQVMRATETPEQFRQRINAAEQEEEYEAEHHGETGTWTFGGRRQTRGSIHSNIWKGTAQDLANRSHIAVYPTTGWWRTRPKEERFDREAHYSLIVTITTPDENTDIYTPVANIIGVPVEVIIA